jgi:hypothetical protein
MARYPRSYIAGTWQPAPVIRPEPPQPTPVIPIAAPDVVPSVLTAEPPNPHASDGT